MTNMSFTERERACGNAIFFSANRLQYASNATKLSVSTQLFDRALLNRNGVNKNGFAVKPEESARTVFCNKKTVGYSEYFKSQQTGKLVEAKYEVHKADYGGEDVVEVNGRRYFVLKTYDTGTDTIEITLTDLRHRNEV